MTENDYTKFAIDAPSVEALASLSKAAVDLYQAQVEVARIEGELKSAQKRLEDIERHLIPDLMEDANLTEITLKNGTKLKVEDVITLPSGIGKNPDVLKWIEETGNGGLIKRSVSVSLGRDADEIEKNILDSLEKQGITNVTTLREVNAVSLKAYVKKLIEAGDEVNTELLGVYQFKRAKITGLPKDGSSAFGE